MKLNEQASSANRAVYNLMEHGEYASSAPHLKHDSIRHLYEHLVSRIFKLATRGKTDPRVLDLGAGDGLATLPFLRLGARVVAVDISEAQLGQLKTRCAGYGDRLRIRCEDMVNVLEEGQRFDIVVMNSVLHHIPDYMAIIERAAQALTADGVFLSFQDPMLRASISTKDGFLSSVAYLCWRVTRGDVIGGAWRHFRRRLGFFSEESPYDNAEYHAVRDGVDQSAIDALFRRAGLDCQVIEYCSFHSGLLQPFGEKLGVRNTFAIVAGRKLGD